MGGAAAWVIIGGGWFRFNAVAAAGGICMPVPEITKKFWLQTKIKINALYLVFGAKMRLNRIDNPQT